ncbi:sensor domain-containing protein [Candidatus Mycobacterium wuenschmannii]|uniref:Sensor domain-containing protein n=1 Tax=Candidatus Mycobacterium wuenschmannii TaxID=3027808 RepID=A0ABY8W026_9MYCO|nr:sensor domain-containing protein [Candidatus Mycobacterium wuenschmannii]WIM89102.1 sensor domain-containing protein [Candidatus Mycobacterium wuenschmannii]
MKRLHLIATCASLIAVAAVGCSHPKNDEDTLNPAVDKPAPTATSQQAAAGDPTAPPAAAPTSSAAPATPPPPAVVAPGKVDGLLLSLDDVSGIISGTLNYEQKFKTPLQPYALGNQSACAVLFGLNTSAVGKDFTTFRALRQQESKDNYSHVVEQEVASYADAASATTAFQNAFKSVDQCNNVTVHRPTDNAGTSWQFQVQPGDPASAYWHNTELTNNNADGWGCAHGARVKNNVIFAVRVCQRGDSGAAVPTILDRLGNSIPA